MTSVNLDTNEEKIVKLSLKSDMVHWQNRDELVPEDGQKNMDLLNNFFMGLTPGILVQFLFYFPLIVFK